MRNAAKEVGDGAEGIVIPAKIANAHQQRIEEITKELRVTESVPGPMNQRLRLLNELSELKPERAEEIKRWWKDRQHPETAKLHQEVLRIIQEGKGPSAR